MNRQLCVPSSIDATNGRLKPPELILTADTRNGQEIMIQQCDCKYLRGICLPLMLPCRGETLFPSHLNLSSCNCEDRKYVEYIGPQCKIFYYEIHEIGERVYCFQGERTVLRGRPWTRRTSEKMKCGSGSTIQDFWPVKRRRQMHEYSQRTAWRQRQLTGHIPPRLRPLPKKRSKTLIIAWRERHLVRHGEKVI